MEEILKKFTSYNIFNYLFPGTVFAVIGDSLTSYSILQDDLLIALFLYYFIGLVISRVGSVVIEPILKTLKVVKFASYPDFLTALKNDNKIEELLESNNMYRTIISLFVFLLGLLIFEKFAEQYTWLGDNAIPVTLVLLLILFVLVYRKQTQYITKRVEASKREQGNNEV